jgi:hypothetical protein
MRRLLVSVLLLLPIACTAALPHLSPDDRNLLESARDAQFIQTLHDIPRGILAACASSAPGHDFRIADPGQPFRAGDVVRDPNEPHRRLIWATRLPDHYIIHYEFGGSGHGYAVLLVREAHGQNHPRVVWAAWGPRLSSYDALRRVLKTHQLTDFTDYYP